MGKIIFMAAFITANLLNVFAMAHEGHDHDAPVTLRAPKGGIIKALDEARVEVVSKGKNVKIYVYDKELKAALTSRFKVIASVELPRSKKVEEIKLVSKKGFFESTYDAKGSHRYTLKLSVTDSKTSRTDDLAYTIEPRK